MATTIEATFDGEVFRPTGPIALPPNTSVRLINEPLPGPPVSFLRTAQALRLWKGLRIGPATWMRTSTARAPEVRMGAEVFLDGIGKGDGANIQGFPKISDR